MTTSMSGVPTNAVPTERTAIATMSMTNIFLRPMTSVSQPPTDVPRKRPTSAATPTTAVQVASRSSAGPSWMRATPMMDST